MANKWTYGPPDFDRHDTRCGSGHARLGRNATASRRHCAALAQLVRALDCGSRGPRFDPERWYHFNQLKYEEFDPVEGRGPSYFPVQGQHRVNTASEPRSDVPEGLPPAAFCAHREMCSVSEATAKPARA